MYDGNFTQGYFTNKRIHDKGLNLWNNIESISRNLKQPLKFKIKKKRVGKVVILRRIYFAFFNYLTK